MKIARDDGITRGIYNVNQATMLRKASFTGFDGNMTDADRWGAITTQTQRWGQEDTNKILAGMAAVTFAPMMAADLLAVGAFAARGGLALGRFSLEGVNNVGRMMYSQYQAHGARGMLLNAGYSTNGLTVEMAKYASLKSAQRTAGYVMRNPLPTFEAGFKASSQFLGKALTNPHVQAGLINGTTNTAADIIFNGFVNDKPEDVNITASFLSGVAGGFVGSRLAALSKPSLRPMIGGMSGSVITEWGDQAYKAFSKGEGFSATDIVIAGAAGAAAGKFVGAGLANYRQTMTAILPTSVTISTIFDETAADTIGNYFNNAVSNWWNNN